MVSKQILQCFFFYLLSQMETVLGFFSKNFEHSDNQPFFVGNDLFCTSSSIYSPVDAVLYCFHMCLLDQHESSLLRFLADLCVKTVAGQIWLFLTSGSASWKHKVARKRRNNSESSLICAVEKLMQTSLVITITIALGLFIPSPDFLHWVLLGH